MTLDRCHSNFLAGLGVLLLALLLAGFGAALVSLAAGDIARALSPIVAAIIGGGFVLTAALIAWKSVDKKIHAEENADRRKFQLAVTAELLCFRLPLFERCQIGIRERTKACRQFQTGGQSLTVRVCTRL